MANNPRHSNSSSNNHFCGIRNKKHIQSNNIPRRTTPIHSSPNGNSIPILLASHKKTPIRRIIRQQEKNNRSRKKMQPTKPKKPLLIRR